MSKIVGQYKNEYDHIIFLENNNKKDIYAGYNKKDNRDVTLKIIKKENVKDVNLLKEKLYKEKNIINICKSDNILDIFRILDTDNNFVLEQEYYETNLHEFILDNGPLKFDKYFFHKIVKEMSKAFKILYDKKILHRKIKSSSIFLKENNGEYQIKLGNFEEAIFIKDNKSEPFDSFYYTAPEIINGEKYDERSDLWSIGITLYDLYFGDLPYGYKPSKMKIIKALSSKDNFNYEKTNIPLLDAIFDGLLQINPEDRITYIELINIMDNKEFMNKNYIYRKKIIKNVTKIPKKGILNQTLSSRKNLTKISYIEKEKYNNILYYDENIDFLKFIIKDCNSFENETPGAFIYCSNIISFQLIKEEIKREKKKNKDIIFNLITSGSTFEKIIKVFSENDELKNYFENKCIYCQNLLKYEIFKNKYKDIIHNNIYDKKNAIIDFIHRTSSEKIRPFEINELITYSKCNSKYDTIFQFSEKLDEKNDKKYFEELEEFINKKNKSRLKIDKTRLLNEFKNITIHSLLNLFLDKIYKDLNNFIIQGQKIEECIAYFTAKIIKCFEDYGNNYNKYYNWKKNKKNEIYMGTNLKLSELLQYGRVKGKIQFPNFIIFYENREFVEQIANRKESVQFYKNNLKFSVIYILKNKGHKCDGINLEDFLSNREKAVLFLPFTPLELKNIKFDFKNFTADIYLE